MSLLYSGIAAALQDAFTTSETTFIWNGQAYGCIINSEQNSLVTSKSLFPVNGYPQPGDRIQVNNVQCQIEGIANSALEFVPGGLSGENQFIDDPNNASLIITYSTFMGK